MALRLGFTMVEKSLVVRFKWCEMARLLTNPTIYLYELLYFMSSFLRSTFSTDYRAQMQKFKIPFWKFIAKMSSKKLF